MKTVDHFKRAAAMFAAISAITARFATDFAKQQAALAALGPYRSRGKGGKKRAARPTGIRAAKRAQIKVRNRTRQRRALRRART